MWTAAIRQQHLHLARRGGVQRKVLLKFAAQNNVCYSSTLRRCHRTFFTPAQRSRPLGISPRDPVPGIRHCYQDGLRKSARPANAKTEIDKLVENVSKSSKGPMTARNASVVSEKMDGISMVSSEDVKSEASSVDGETRVETTKPPLIQRIKDEAKHYWLGTKLLWAELKIATGHILRVLQGHTLTRRERNQLIRTSNDIVRLVPFSMFVLIPFMELLLPVAVAVFPGLLPSTYTTKKKRQENMKRKLRARVEMAHFLQDLMEHRAKQIKKRKDSALRGNAEDLLGIVSKAREGHPMSNESILTLAKLFKDDITLDTMSRPQLVTLCRFVGVTVFGNPSAVMRMQLRAHLRAIKADDRMIMWEGIHTLTKQELMQACQDRGMRGTNLSEFALRHQLQQWLELSVRQDLPLAFLILSRAMQITASNDRVERLAETISRMEDQVVKEAVRESAVDGSSDPELKLESLQIQSELIEEEKKSARSASRVAEVIDIEEEEEERSKLSVEELEALSVLASESAVEMERNEIEKIKERQAELDEEVASASSTEGRVTGPAGWDDGVESNIRSRLQKMLDELDEETQEVDESIGDDLHVLDRDHDGVMTNEEIRDAIKNVLRTHNTDAEADAVVRLLDSDGDGNVTKEELLYYAHITREKRATDNDDGDSDKGGDEGPASRAIRREHSRKRGR